MKTKKKYDHFFSIITPVYNGKKYLSGYVKALKEQLWEDWEAIIIDDNSSDGTYEFLEELIEGDERFQLETNKKTKGMAGPYQARNIGISLSQGKWICFLDIDDIWLPSKLQQQANTIQMNEELKFEEDPVININYYMYIFLYIR